MITIRLPWRFRLKRWLGFDSIRRRGVLFIPDELTFPDTVDTFLNHLIDLMTQPLGPLPRWYRFRRWAGFDSVRRVKTIHDPSSLVPIILRGPAAAAP